VEQGEEEEVEMEVVVVEEVAVVVEEAAVVVEEVSKVNVVLQLIVQAGHQSVVSGATARQQTSQMVTQMLENVPLAQTVLNGHQIALSLVIAK